MKDENHQSHPSRIAAAPLYFVRSGGIGIIYGRLWAPGIDGDLWSHTAGADSAIIHYLVFNATDSVSSNSFSRWLGIPLRCLAL